MQTLLAIFLVLGIAALIVIVISRGISNGPLPSSSSSNKTRSPRARTMHRYQAVSICAMDGHCQGAGDLAEHRFLVKNAPPLPLPECNADTCQCRYVRHEDRRHQGWDRRLAIDTEDHVYEHEGGSERRHERGRRKSDWAMA